MKLIQSIQALLKFALRYPEAEEGIACQGTTLETCTVKARNKAFLFLGKANVKVKLRDSLAEAEKLAAKEPERFQVGGHGWVSIRYGPDTPLPVEILKRWIAESYRLFAPKEFAEGGQPAEGSMKTSKKKVAKKKPAKR